MSVKKKKKRLAAPTITSVQFEQMRKAFYTYGSVAKAAQAAGIRDAQAARYVNQAHEAFGGVSIREMVRVQKENEARELMTSVQVTRHSALQEHTRRMLETLRSTQRVRLSPNGDAQPDGTISVTAAEYAKIMSVVESELRVIDRLSERIFPEEEAQREVQVALRFQGQRDMGTVINVPAEPVTMFENQLKIQSENREAFDAALSSGDGDAAIAAIRRAVQKRLQDA